MSDPADGADGDSSEEAGKEPADSDHPVVALDTSILMAPVEANLRLFEELERLLPEARLVVPESVLTELEGLASGGTASEEGTAASVGRELAERAETVATEEGYADDALVALATGGRVDYVATVDADLRERVHARSVPTICLRGGRKLTVSRL